MKISVVIGRFQSPYLHDGHKHILNVAKQNGKLVVLIGTRPGQATSKNPLSFDARKRMIEQEYLDSIVKEIIDNKSDLIWSQRVDSSIDADVNDDVTLYGSRDSFIQSYSGKYKTQVIDEIPEINATQIRETTASSVIDSVNWRKGIIHGVHKRLPISYQCVDIVVIKKDPPGTFYAEILVGKKIGEDKWRFIGGFVDPSDESLERAAKREVMEECNNIETDNYTYLASARIDDWRYRGSKDGVMTAFFICKYIFGHPEPKDDINELKFISILDLRPENFEQEHRHLVEILINYLNTHKR